MTYPLSIYRKVTSPYYIFAPRWIDSSAGIKVLHYLCHALNQIGEEAYLVISDPYFRSQPRVNGKLDTPVLTKEQMQMHIRGKRNPIVIYSETIKGNPLHSTNVVRYLLNYSGTLGGNAVFPKTEFLTSFTRNIATDYSAKTGESINTILFLPPIDSSDFVFNSIKEPFQLVYAGKYRSFIGAPLNVGEQSVIEIWRDGPKMQSREQVIKLLSKASVLYCFENSSIITEAILSGTPVLLVQSKFFEKVIAEHELGWGGMRFYGDANALTEAKNSLREGCENYHASESQFWQDLENFVFLTQTHFQASVPNLELKLPGSYLIFLGHKSNLALQIFRTKGLQVLIRAIVHYFMRHIGLKSHKKT
jgi:hypothetical protein